jgi:hypothetical protein
MRHIKLYENWLNEAKGSNIPNLLDKGLARAQYYVDSELNTLAKYGNLSNQIRGYINSYRNQYLPSSSWKEMNTAPGLSAGMEKFKELYQKAIVGDVANTPLRKTLSRIFNYSTTDKIWYSKETVRAAEIIKNGDDSLADSVGASIILFQLGTALTKGLYYYSGNIALNLPEVKTVQAAVDSLNIDGIEDIIDYGSDFFSITATENKPSYMTAGSSGRTFTYDTYEVDYRVLKESKISPFVRTLSLDNVINLIKGETSTYSMANVFFSTYFVGSYVGENTVVGISSASKFMETGGPTWYNEILA